MHYIKLLKTINTIVANCTNRAGKKCEFPFHFGGKLQYGCVTGGRNAAEGVPWCEDERGNGNWDYCGDCKGS